MAVIQVRPAVSPPISPVKTDKSEKHNDGKKVRYTFEQKDPKFSLPVAYPNEEECNV